MKVFDFERAYSLMISCTDIFGRDWISIERVEKNNTPYLRISYKNSSVNFSYSKDEDIIEQEDKKEESDIFKITQSSMYKDKIKDVSNKNSHTIGDRYNVVPHFNENKITNKNNNINKSKNEISPFEYPAYISKVEKELQIFLWEINVISKKLSAMKK